MGNILNSNYPLVSISCTTYNHKNYIRDAIEGFLKQKAKFQFEILLHDDASTDGTNEIIKEYEHKYPDLIFPVYQKENQYSKGVVISPTFNWPRARGKYIALCEGDDYWTDPYKLQKQVDFMEANPGYSLCVGGYLRLEEKTSSKTEVKKKVKNAEFFNNGFTFNLNDLTKGWLTKTLTALFRTEILGRIDITCYKYGRDIQLFYHILKDGGKGFYFNDILGVYRVHQGGINSTKKGRINLNVAYNIYKELYEHNKDDFTRYMYFRHSLKLFNYNLYNKDSEQTNTKQLRLLTTSFKLICSFKEFCFFMLEFFPKGFRINVYRKIDVLHKRNAKD